MRLTRMAVGVVLVGTLAGCGNSTSGVPTAGDASVVAGSSTQETSPTTSEAQDARDLDLYDREDLCKLLTEEEATSLGGSPIGEPGNSVTDGHPVCTWSSETGLVVGTQRNLRLTDVKTGPGITNTDVEVAGQPAVQSQETDPFLICQILVEIPDNLLLGVSASNRASGEGKYKPCAVARELANTVIPKVT